MYVHTVCAQCAYVYICVEKCVGFHCCPLSTGLSCFIWKIHFQREAPCILKLYKSSIYLTLCGLPVSFEGGLNLPARLSVECEVRMEL